MTRAIQETSKNWNSWIVYIVNLYDNFGVFVSLDKSFLCLTLIFSIVIYSKMRKNINQELQNIIRNKSDEKWKLA